MQRQGPPPLRLLLLAALGRVGVRLVQRLRGPLLLVPQGRLRPLPWPPLLLLTAAVPRVYLAVPLLKRLQL